MSTTHESTTNEDGFAYSLGEETVRVVFRDHETGLPIEATVDRATMYRFAGIMRRLLGPAPA